MGTLSVWKFDTAEGAGQAVGTLEDLAKQQLITVLDAATVSWPEGAKRPKTRELFTNLNDDQEKALRQAFAE
jgi:uncharacterized membrane protein